VPKLKPTCPRNKTGKTAGVCGVSPVGGKIEKLWSKGLLENICFEPGVSYIVIFV